MDCMSDDDPPVEIPCHSNAYSQLYLYPLEHGEVEQIPTAVTWSWTSEDSGEYGLAFIYTPDEDFVGTDTFGYGLTDFSWTGTTVVPSSDDATVTIHITDDPPEIVDDEYEVDEDDDLIMTSPGVIDNDSSPVGDDISVTLETDVEHGALTLNSDGSFDYTPDPDFHGEDSFVYRGHDGFEYAFGTVTITVKPVNDAPNGANDVYSVPVADPANTLTKNSATGVLSNDTDTDEDELEVASVSGIYPGTVGSAVTTPHGVVTLNENGSFDYTPTGSYHGTDSFTYTVTDGVASSSPITVTILVNSAPEVLTPFGAQFTTINTAMAPTTVISSGSAADLDGDPLTASLVGSAPSGLTLNANGVFNYTPPTDFLGVVYLTYVLNDGLADSDQGIVALYVRPIGLSDGGYSTPSGQILNVNATSGVLTNDIAGAYTKTVDGYTQPSDGSLTLNSDGSFSYTPDPLFVGIDSFTYCVKANGMTSSPMTTVTITAT